MTTLGDFLERHRTKGAIFIRLFAGGFLIYMSQDNVFGSARMREFEGFLGQYGFPVPRLAAPISVYAQFLSGIAFILGAFTRAAAFLMIANFVVALAMVHTRLPFREALDPSAMLASAAFLLFNGAGPLSVDSWHARRSRKTAEG